MPDTFLNFSIIWNEIMSFCTSSESTLIFSALILAFWLSTILLLTLKIYNHRRVVVNHYRLLSEIRSEDELEMQFEKINADFMEEPYLRDHWEAFSKTLIWENQIEKNKSRIRATSIPNNFFDPNLYLDQHFDQSFYNAVPNYLTGAGIFFTFIGLAAGIYQAKSGFASGSLVQITESLRQLLGGASLAFWTSVVGLACSISFSWYSKNSLHGLRGVIGKLSHEMKRLFPLTTHEAIAYSQLLELRKQSHQLQLFNTDLAVSIAEALDSRISSQLIGLVESVKNVLNSLIEETLMPKLERITLLLESIRSDRGEALQDLLQDVAKKFEESLRAATQEEFVSLANGIKELSILIAKSKDTMESAQVQLMEAMKRMESEAGQGLTEICNLIRTSSQEMVNQLKTAGRDISNSITHSAEEIKLRIDEVASNLVLAGETVEEKFESVQSHVDAISERLKDVANLLFYNLEEFKRGLQETKTIISSSHKVIEANNETIKQLENATKSIITTISLITKVNDQFLQVSERIKETAELSKWTKEEINKLINTLERERQSMAQAWSKYEERFKNLDEKLQSVFKEINNGLEAYVKNLKNYIENLESHMAEAVKTLGGGISELTESIEDLNNLLTKVREQGK